MAKASCVLDIMKEKGIIELNNENDELKRFNFHIRNINDDNIKREIHKKIFKKLLNSEEYLLVETFGQHIKYFAKTENVREYIEKFLESEKEYEEHPSINYPDTQQWIKENYPNIDMNYLYIYNTEIKEKRKQQEKENDQKAIELLNNIL